MEIPTSSSKAQDREVAVWYQKINNADIKLPRFQRFEAWDRHRIASFLNTIIHNLPVGVTLLLEVGDEEKFPSRHIETAPQAERRPYEHLLDGQQRLTALWRAVNNNYERETFYVYLPEFDATPDDYIQSDEIFVYCVPRWSSPEKRYPLWADDPRKCLAKGLVPIHLLRPEPIGAEIDNWIDEATRHLEPADGCENLKQEYQKFLSNQKHLKETLTRLREVVTHFNLPYLALPVQTRKDTALRVFINMNTNTKPLSTYDIIVAEVESARGESLHSLQAGLEEELPELGKLDDVSRLILTTAALLQNRTPSERGMIEMDKGVMVDRWTDLTRCMRLMLGFMEGERIFDKQRLPTNVVLPVVAALYDQIPDSGDERGQAEGLLRKYVWSSFFTGRYENAAGSRAFGDFRQLKRIITRATKEDGSFYQEDDVPVLNRQQYPIMTVQEMLNAPWPHKQTIIGRAMLAVSILHGADDFADGTQVTRDSLSSREYHHIFPDALLKEAEVDSYLALNCALISAPTNRKVGRKDPLEYIKDRYGWVGDEVVHHRLASHLIPVPELMKASYANLEGESKKVRIREDFQSFTQRRAEIMVRAASSLAEGRKIPANELLRGDSETAAE
ncbi:DUF262 domain-containing protein, partial [Myxococcota bacterium]